jgi:hypothetical protein
VNLGRFMFLDPRAEEVYLDWDTVADDTVAALATTSWVGKASRDFAARNGRIQISERRYLQSLLLEHLGKDMLIGLPKLPPGWERSDLS